MTTRLLDISYAGGGDGGVFDGTCPCGWSAWSTFKFVVRLRFAFHAHAAHIAATEEP